MTKADPAEERSHDFLTRPISAGLLLLTVAVLIIVFLPSVKKKRAEVFVDVSA